MGSERERTRREFLRWMGLAPGAAAALAGVTLSLGCSDDAGAGNGGDAGGDGAEDGGDAALPDAVADADTDAALPDAVADADTDATELGGGDLGDEEVEGGVCSVTGSDVQGPFFEPGAPERAMLAAVDEPGERLTMEGVVYGPDCTTPLSGALLDVWQADAEGEYHGAEEEYRLRGQILTAADGSFAFDTIRPGRYPQGASFRPAHIHFMVSAPGHQPLTTQLYFEGDPYLAPNDPCTTCGSDDETHIVALEEVAAGESSAWRGSFEIVLQRTG